MYISGPFFSLSLFSSLNQTVIFSILIVNKAAKGNEVSSVTCMVLCVRVYTHRSTVHTCAHMVLCVCTHRCCVVHTQEHWHLKSI